MRTASACVHSSREPGRLRPSGRSLQVVRLPRQLTCMQKPTITTAKRSKRRSRKSVTRTSAVPYGARNQLDRHADADIAPAQEVAAFSQSQVEIPLTSVLKHRGQHVGRLDPIGETARAYLIFAQHHFRGRFLRGPRSRMIPAAYHPSAFARCTTASRSIIGPSISRAPRCLVGHLHACSLTEPAPATAARRTGRP